MVTPRLVRILIGMFQPLTYFDWFLSSGLKPPTLLGTNISRTKAFLKMIFLFPRWDMLVPWRVAILFHSFDVICSRVLMTRSSRWSMTWHLMNQTCPPDGGLGWPQDFQRFWCMKCYGAIDRERTWALWKINMEVLMCFDSCHGCYALKYLRFKHGSMFSTN